MLVKEHVRGGLRFEVGQRVSCKVSDEVDGWKNGTITQLMPESEGRHPVEDAVHDIELDCGSSCAAPIDNDETVRELKGEQEKDTAVMKKDPERSMLCDGFVEPREQDAKRLAEERKTRE